MAALQKLLAQVLRGTSDANIAFTDLCKLLKHLGFDERISGSHHVFVRRGVEEQPNLQRDGKHAKPYQVRQVRQVIVKYKLASEL